jgi:membrane protein
MATKQAATGTTGKADAVKPSGHNAASPWQMPWPAWKQVAIRTVKETGNDNVGLIAAGVAFYGFLALVPLLGAIVLSYGLIAEPATVIKNMQGLTSVMPGDAAKLVGEQLMNVVKTSDGKKGAGLLLALALALFGARNGAGAIVTALNVAYEEEETRGFIRVNLLSLAITAGGVVVAMLALVAITALGHLESLLENAPGFVVVLGKIVSYLAMTLAGAAGAATLYRFGPARKKAQWTWLTPGSMLAALLWLALTIGFGIYVANFGNYNATYGSLGAVVVLLTWLYLSSYILLFGAELNSELEHQTAADTTSGKGAPVGERGAWAADHVAAGETSADGGGEQVGAASAGHAAPAAAHESAVGDFVASRVGAHLAHLGGPKVGMAISAAATLGLSLLRKQGRGAAGAAVLAGAGAVAWLTREEEEEDQPASGSPASDSRVMAER